MGMEGGVGYSLEKNWCGQCCNYGVAYQLITCQISLSSLRELFGKGGVAWGEE